MSGPCCATGHIGPFVFTPRGYGAKPKVGRRRALARPGLPWVNGAQAPATYLERVGASWPWSLRLLALMLSSRTGVPLTVGNYTIPRKSPAPRPTPMQSWSSVIFRGAVRTESVSVWHAENCDQRRPGSPALPAPDWPGGAAPACAEGVFQGACLRPLRGKWAVIDRRFCSPMSPASEKPDHQGRRWEGGLPRRP